MIVFQFVSSGKITLSSSIHHNITSWVTLSFHSVDICHFTVRGLGGMLAVNNAEAQFHIGDYNHMKYLDLKKHRVTCSGWRHRSKVSHPVGSWGSAPPAEAWLHTGDDNEKYPDLKDIQTPEDSRWGSGLSHVPASQRIGLWDTTASKPSSCRGLALHGSRQWKEVLAFVKHMISSSGRWHWSKVSHLVTSWGSTASKSSSSWGWASHGRSWS